MSTFPKMSNCATWLYRALSTNPIEVYIYDNRYAPIQPVILLGCTRSRDHLPRVLLNSCHLSTVVLSYQHCVFCNHMACPVLFEQLHLCPLLSEPFTTDVESDENILFQYTFSKPVQGFERATFLSQVCFSQVKANHPTDCQCGLLRHHRSCN